MKDLIKKLEGIKYNYRNEYALTRVGFQEGIEEAIKQINLTIPSVMHCFSDITEEPDSIEDLVLDYNALKWLNEQGYYDDNFKLIASKGTAPIFTAIKEAKKQIDSTENKILKHLLSLRIK